MSDDALDTYVYFMIGTCRHGMRVMKIGISSNVAQRKQTAACEFRNGEYRHLDLERLDVLTTTGPHTREDARYWESEFHGLFDQYRMYGEWFYTPDATAVLVVLAATHQAWERHVDGMVAGNGVAA